jgi:hypothetical protein
MGHEATLISFLRLVFGFLSFANLCIMGFGASLIIKANDWLEYLFAWVISFLIIAITVNSRTIRSSQQAVFKIFRCFWIPIVMLGTTISLATVLHYYVFKLRGVPLFHEMQILDVNWNTYQDRATIGIIAAILFSVSPIAYSYLCGPKAQ